jgi:hypothetical protein
MRYLNECKLRDGEMKRVSASIFGGMLLVLWAGAANAALVWTVTCQSCDADNTLTGMFTHDGDDNYSSISLTTTFVLIPLPGFARRPK